MLALKCILTQSLRVLHLLRIVVLYILIKCAVLSSFGVITGLGELLEALFLYLELILMALEARGNLFKNCHSVHTRYRCHCFYSASQELVYGKLLLFSLRNQTLGNAACHPIKTRVWGLSAILIGVHWYFFPSYETFSQSPLGKIHPNSRIERIGERLIAQRKWCVVEKVSSLQDVQNRSSL